MLLQSCKTRHNLPNHWGIYCNVLDFDRWGTLKDSKIDFIC